ncbi:hypothetical protein T07_2547 [Trichinella nelsoni]|uniref:Uncharacterized protein n=1 Tax=Trichinella nelsoni TaxID=6336 RepID=A0A0V0R9X5_9BILA|nr:hypothetical protein T07_2547 [Trichinella nelsoni]
MKVSTSEKKYRTRCQIREKVNAKNVHGCLRRII